MPLSKKEQERIVSQESAWVDSAFGGLDLSQFPDLQSQPPADKHADKFARAWNDRPFNADQLREFIQDPDTETLQRVADEIGHQGFANEVRDRKGEIVAQQFKKLRPYYPSDENRDRMTQTMAFNFLPEHERDGDTETVINRLIDAGVWDVQHLCAVFDALNAEGLLEMEAGEPRSLTGRERLRIARLAQAGRVDEAIGEYLRCALDGDEPTMELVNDPKYRGLCDDAVLTVFEETQLDYVPTAARKAYLLRFAGNRPLTIPLLQQAWKSCQQNESRRERSAVLEQVERPEPQPVTPQQIDALDDASVDRLYHASLAEYARSYGRPGGLIV